MEVRQEEFPIVIQAYDASHDPEVFIAEQVVNTQLEIDDFTARYSGKLIKARTVTETEYQRQPKVDNRRKSSAGALWVIILLIIVILTIIGFTTGWIQRTFDITI